MSRWHRAKILSTDLYLFCRLSREVSFCLCDTSTSSLCLCNRVLLAAVRDKGLCPCPRCLVQKSQLDLMGLVRDMRTRISRVRVFLWDKVKRAREYIYQSGLPINGTAVNDLLKETSSIPTFVRSLCSYHDYFSKIYCTRMRSLTGWVPTFRCRKC